MHPSRLICSVVVAILACGTPHAAELKPVANKIPPTPPGVFDLSKVSKAPVPTHQVRPNFPKELLPAGIGGDATILFTVRKDGSVTDVLVVKATDASFGTAASEAVSKWKFRPGLVDGAPVDCRLMVPIKFSPTKK